MASSGYAWPLSVAPMMKVTDRWWRVFGRCLSRETLFYSEMLVDNAVLFSGKELASTEGNLALQLGGNDPRTLGEATSWLLERFPGCVEVNLNCGCPSAVVASKNCFGARLMLEPELVRQIVAEMSRRSSNVPVTVKHRLGTDLGGADYEDTASFVRAAASGGARHFVVHTRMAILGTRLSCDQNRSIPPLVPKVAHDLRKDFPELTFSINGGLKNLESCENHLKQGMHSAMVGRAAWYTPFELLGTADTRIFQKKTNPANTRRRVITQYADHLDDYFDTQDDDALQDDDLPIFRPLYYAFTGLRNAKKFRIALVSAAQQRQRAVFKRNKGHVAFSDDSSLDPPSAVIADAMRDAGISDDLLDIPFLT